MKRKQHSIDSVANMAHQAGVTLLSKTYVNNSTNLKFVCSEGHEFERNIKSILKHNIWCTKCNRSVAEELCRHILETALSARFKKTWFEHKGHRLELDGYNKELGLAFEYNGKQHYEITYMTPDETSLRTRKELDALKVEYCHDNEIRLLVVPYTVLTSELKSHIGNELGIDVSKVDTENFSNGYSYYRNRRDSLAKKISSKSGTLVDFQLDTVTVMCASGHTWTTRRYLIENGHWCNQCYYNGNKLTYDDVATRTLAGGVQCLSSAHEFIDTSTLMEFQCSKGHRFHDTAQNLLSRIENKNASIKRMACRFCPNPKQQSAIQKLFNQGLTLVNETEYNNKNQLLQWRCINGHIQVNKMKNFMERFRKGYPLCRECVH